MRMTKYQITLDVEAVVIVTIEADSEEMALVEAGIMLQGADARVEVGEVLKVKRIRGVD